MITFSQIMSQKEGSHRARGRTGIWELYLAGKCVHQLLYQHDSFSRTTYFMTPASQRGRTNSFLVQVWVKVRKDHGGSKVKILQLDFLNDYFYSNVSKMIYLHSHTHIHTKETQKGEKENNGKPIFLPVYKFSLDDCQDLQLYWIP